MGYSDGAHAVFVAELFQAVETPRPGDQVVDLVHVDAARVVAQGAVDLALGLLVVRSPYLGRDQRAVASARERLAEDALGGTVHRR